MTHAIGIDIGGTKTAGAVVDTRTGQILRSLKRPTHASKGGCFVLELCRSIIQELDGTGLPLGIGLCELVDRNGRVAGGVTVDWRDMDLPKLLGPVRLESDVRAAALAESRFGAGQGHDNFLYLSIGTGIAHTLVLDGRPYLGAHGHAIMVGAPPTEFCASGTALSAATNTDPRVALTDETHAPLIDSASQALGQTLATLIHALDPGSVVIGGGLGLNSRYRARVVSAARANLDPELFNSLRFDPAGLGEGAGVVGAALTSVTRP